jgi:hypothetical protein
MAGLALWDALKKRVGARRPAMQWVALQAVGLCADDLRALRPLLDEVGEQLAVRFRLDPHEGEVLLIDADFAARTQPQLSRLMRGDRPVVLLSGMVDGGARTPSAATSLERLQQQLLCQLREIAVVRDRSARWAPSGWAPEVTGIAGAGAASAPGRSPILDSGFEAEADERQMQDACWSEPQRLFVLQVLRGLHDEDTAALAASYGADAHVSFDFRSRLVHIDPLALQGLRVKRQLPLIAPGTQPAPDASHHELDDIVWDLGMACGRFGLMNCPDDCWHAPLIGVAASQIERFSRQPRHLAAARRLLAGPASPEQLRRHVGISVPDLRRFIQAGLFLGLLRWGA